MKKIFMFLAVWFFFATPVWGSPFFVSNADTTTNPPTYYQVTIDSGTPVSSPVQAVTGGVRLHHDIATLNLLVTHNFNVKACKTNNVGVEVCSTTVNFIYPAPVAPVAPSGVTLEK